MRGDEARVVAAFRRHLEEEGWTVDAEVGFCDLVGVRDGSTLYVEAKGRTTSPGLDVDTMYGQLLRRMPVQDDPSARFAVVVPDVALQAVLRVPGRVREALRIDAYSVDADGAVTGPLR